MSITIDYGCTEKQFSFIRRLVAERFEQPDEALQRYEQSLSSSRSASALIDDLLATPKLQRQQQTYVGPGYYEVDGTVYKVQPSRATERCYAKRLRVTEKGGSWEYESGAMAAIKPEHAVDLERAKAFGRTHGFCIACGALLTDPASIEAGIGPVCATKF